MYESFYRLNEKPFSLTPDPKFLYLSKQHQGALDHMLYGIRQREGFMTIVGDVGTGKTTLCRCLLDRLERNIQVALILNPMLSDMDLLRTCVHDLGVVRSSAHTEKAVAANASGDEIAIDPESLATPIEEEEETEPDMGWINHASKKELIDALNAFLLAQHSAGGSTVLIIDEAQNLSLDVMEQLRILSNLETEKEKLLQIIFVGQLELNDKLKLPELKQLNQRISIRYEITPLSPDETVQYINHRVLVAGAGSRVTFTRPALKEVYNYSKGYPRLINLVCDRALLAGYNAQVDSIDRPQVKQGIKSLMGEEDKSYFRNYYLTNRMPVFASALFFLAGLAFFTVSEFDVDWRSEGKKILSRLGVNEIPILNVPTSRVSLNEKSLEVGKPNPPIAKPVKEVSPPKPVQTAAVDPKSVSLDKESGKVDAVNSPAESGKDKASGEAAGDYRIQLYSLQDSAEAKEEVRKLAEEGFNAYLRQAASGEQEWYMVYVGPFKEAKSARIHVDALKFSGRNPILLSVAKSN